MGEIVKDYAAPTVENQGYVKWTLGIAKGVVKLDGLNLNVTPVCTFNDLIYDLSKHNWLPT